MSDFKAAVDAWVTQTEERMLAVAKESTQRLTSTITNNVPVDTGFARASVRASLSSMPQIQSGFTGQKGNTYQVDLGEITASIAGLTPGETIYVGWTASYIAKLEYGHSKQAPQGFVRLGCMQWPQIVADVVSEAKGRSSA